MVRGRVGALIAAMVVALMSCVVTASPASAQSVAYVLGGWLTVHRLDGSAGSQTTRLPDAHDLALDATDTTWITTWDPARRRCSIAGPLPSQPAFHSFAPSVRGLRARRRCDIEGSDERQVLFTTGVNGRNVVRALAIDDQKVWTVGVGYSPTMALRKVAVVRDVGLRFRPRGTAVFAGQASAPLRRVLPRSRRDRASYFAPALSPDAQQLAAARLAERGRSEVVVVSMRSRRTRARWRVPTGFVVTSTSWLADGAILVGIRKPGDHGTLAVKVPLVEGNVRPILPIVTRFAVGPVHPLAIP